jgi:hypothetical protein
MASRWRSSVALVAGLLSVLFALGVRPTWAELRDPDEPAAARPRSSATVGEGSSAGAVPRRFSARIECPSEPRLGVHDPRRLQILGTCRWAVGIVAGLAHEPDGDWHVNLRPSPPFVGLEDAGNRTAVGDALVTEIMPGQSLPVPAVGERVEVFGTWIHDKNHGWNEIHPIWAIRYVDRNQTIVSIP